MGILWSQQQKLTAAAEALKEWQGQALALDVSVTQVNLTLTDPSGRPRSVVFRWDTEAGEYALETIDV